MSFPRKFSCFLCLIVLILAALPCPAQQAKTIVRVFRIRYAEPADVSTAVQALLSDRGSITVQPSRKRITVRDSPEQMNRIVRAVEEMDVKPEHFRIEVILLQGMAKLGKGEDPYPISERLKKMFPFNVYTELGRAELQGTVGDAVNVELGGKYELSMTVQKLRQENFAFGFDVSKLGLELQPLVLSEMRDASVPRRILKTRIVLAENQELSIGAGASEDARNGLVLMLRALRAESP